MPNRAYITHKRALDYSQQRPIVTFASLRLAGASLVLCHKLDLPQDSCLLFVGAGPWQVTLCTILCIAGTPVMLASGMPKRALITHKEP